MHISYRTKINLFFIAYIIYMLSTFLADLPKELIGIEYAIKSLRYLSYVLFAVNIYNKKINKKAFFLLTLFFCIFCTITILTKDFYYAFTSLIVLSAMSSRNITYIQVIKVSYYTLLISASIVLFLTVIGILPNTYNIKDGDTFRYSLGYYHSNVFPMILFFLFSWRIILKNKISNLEVFLFLAGSFIAYKLCYSRSGIIGSMSLVGYVIYNNIHRNNRKNHFVSKKVIDFVRILEKQSILLLSTFSLIMMVIAGKQYQLVYKLNLLFSGRFALAYLKMRNIGLHLINTINNEEYNYGDYVIDNGYLFIILRYGILFILFYMLIQYMICKKYNSKVAFVFLITTVTSFIDNDLFSYGFLPYIFIAFQTTSDGKAFLKNIMLKKEIRVEKKTVDI